MSSFPETVQVALDKAATSKAAADQAAATQATADATAQAADADSKAKAAQLTTDAAGAIAALTNFLVVSPPQAPIANQPTVAVTGP